MEGYAKTEASLLESVLHHVHHISYPCFSQAAKRSDTSTEIQNRLKVHCGPLPSLAHLRPLELVMSSTSLPSSMRAWLFAPGRGRLEDKLKLHNDVPLPKEANKLKEGEVLVKVKACSLNPVDYKLAEIPIISRLILGSPASPGLDFSGVIAAAGPKVDELHVGQRVWGRLQAPAQYGTLCEYVVSSTKSTVGLPDKVSFQDGAGLATTALTAYQSIVPFVNKGQSVFINGGSGGTGVFGIQIAKALGCFVSTCCSGANEGLCKGLGADQVINYRDKDVAEELQKGDRRFDLVVDNVGTIPAIYWKCNDFTAPGATFAQVGAEFSNLVDFIKRRTLPSWLGAPQRRYLFVGVENKRDDFLQIAKWVEEGKIKAVNDEVFAYENAPQAYARLKTGRARGKVVVVVDEG